MKVDKRRKEDRREILYRFRANLEESSLIESRYIQSSCSSISEFFRQAVINDMMIQNSEEELKNISLLLESVLQGLHHLTEHQSSKERIAEMEREASAAWQQLQCVQSTLRKLKH